MSFPRPDMSGLQGLNDYAATLRPEGFAEQLRERAQAIREMHERVRELRGTASSDDGYVSATYTGVDGFDGLVLDPRAMRMPSGDLAAEILSVSRSAREDYEQQQREVTAEFAPATSIDIEEAERNVAEISESAALGLADMQAMFERFRNQMGR